VSKLASGEPGNAAAVRIPALICFRNSFLLYAFELKRFETISLSVKFYIWMHVRPSASYPKLSDG
jgi:hypothetical protein